MPTDVRGRFLWHELLTSDPVAAQKFYKPVVGWDTQNWDESPTPYTMWTAGGVPVGGVMELPPRLVEMKVPPNWLTHIGTPDVDATIAKAKTLGGSVMNPGMVAPNVGRWAVLADPSGSVFSIFTPENDSPPNDGAAPIGDFSWHELATKDLDKAVDFYQQLFGWVETSSMDMGEMGPYRMFGRTKEVPLGGMYRIGTQMPVPPHWMPYAHVADIKKSADAITKGGGQIVNGPMEVPGGDWIVMGVDPQGAMFAVHQTKQG